MASKRFLTLAVGACFFLSGAAGLVYEVVWMRLLGLVLGHTVLAITTVLVAFMTGLALGASLFGRLIDRRGRPLLVYSGLEVGIGLYGALVPVLLTQAQAAYLALYRALEPSPFAFGLARFVLVSLILLPPTTLMGASLPLLAKLFEHRTQGPVGRKVGDLYALNTFGAVAGTGAAGFTLLPSIGVSATTALAASVNVATGVIALIADRLLADGWAPADREGRVPDPPTIEPRHGGEPASLATWLALAGVGLSGAASMVYEITWTRALSLVIGSSVYAFSAMLTTFLVGLALGSFLFARIFGGRPAGAGVFGSLQIGAGLTALALVPAFERMPDLVLLIVRRLSPSATTALLSQFSLSFLVMLVPTTLLGAAFPSAVQICAREGGRIGRDVGRVYATSTTGTIAGALLAGFALVPFLGVQASMTSAAALNVAVGVAVLAVSGAGRRWHRVALIPLILLFTVGVAFVPRWDPRVMTAGVSIYARKFSGEPDPVLRFRQEAASRELLFYREGWNSTVAVERTARMTSLKVDGKVDASNGLDMLTQLMLGHLPLLLHPEPQRVLVIGLGSGVTLGAVTQHRAVREIDVVELEPAVVEASRFFARENRDALRDPRVRLLIGDARNVVLARPKRYDVISSEPSNPWMAGVGNLFSREFYRLASERLSAGGIMVQWVHGYSLFPRELRMIVATFRAAFPHTTLWRTIRGDYLLVGSRSPLTLDYALLEPRSVAAVREDLASVGLESPVDLLTLFFVDEAGLDRFARGAPENTDDRPLLEFAAPLALYAETTDENSRLLRESRTAEFPPIANLPAGLPDARRPQFARAYWARGEREEALEQLRRAPPPDADDVPARLERAKLRFSLGDLHGATAELARLAERRPHDRLIGSYLKAGAMLGRFGAQEALAQHARTRYGNPDPAEALNNIGVFHTHLGLRSGEPAFFDLAVDALEAARRIEPGAYPVINNLGNAYFELGRLEEAAQVYRQVIALAPGEAEARFNLGLVYERQGKLAMAIRELETANALKPAWALPRMRLAQLRRAAAGR